MDAVNSVGAQQSIASQGFGTDIETADDLQTDFLNLLIAQLSNQDPMSPMDNEGMIQQLATFSQLQQLERVNENLETSMGYNQSLNNTMMMDVAGKRVTVLGDGIRVENGQATRSVIRVPEGGKAYPRVVDSVTGQTVRTLDPIRVDKGFNTIEWDGKGDDGNPLPDGDYKLEVSAKSGVGEFMSMAIFRSGIVDTVQFDNNFVYFEVDGQRYTPADVVEVGVRDANDGTPIDSTDDGSDVGDGVEVGDGDDGDGDGDDTVNPGIDSGDVTPPWVDDPWTPPSPDAQSIILGGGSQRPRSPWEALLRIR